MTNLKLVGEQLEKVREKDSSNTWDIVRVVEMAEEEGYSELYRYVYDNQDRWLSALIEAREAAGYPK